MVFGLFITEFVFGWKDACSKGKWFKLVLPGEAGGGALR